MVPARESLQLTHLLGRGPGPVYRSLGMLAQVFWHARIEHQELGVADGKRQLVGNAVLHGAGSHARTFEPGGFGLASPAQVFAPNVDRDVHHNGPASDQNDRQRHTHAQLLSEILVAVERADKRHARYQRKPDQSLDPPQQVRASDELVGAPRGAVED